MIKTESGEMKEPIHGDICLLPDGRHGKIKYWPVEQAFSLDTWIRPDQEQISFGMSDLILLYRESDESLTHSEWRKDDE